MFFALIKNELQNSRRDERGRRYTKTVKNLCTAIYLKSPMVYRMLREMIAIPGRESLRLYSLDLFSETGITPEIERLLRSQVSTMTELQKVSILSFDETDIKPEFSYHPRHVLVDRYVDLGNGQRQCRAADHALVFAIRGIAARARSSQSKRPSIFYS